MSGTAHTVGAGPGTLTQRGAVPAPPRRPAPPPPSADADARVADGAADDHARATSGGCGR